MKHIAKPIKKLMSVTGTKNFKLIDSEVDNFGYYYRFTLDSQVCTVALTKKSSTYYLIVGYSGATMFSENFARLVYNIVEKEFERGTKNEK